MSNTFRLLQLALQEALDGDVLNDTEREVLGDAQVLVTVLAEDEARGTLYNVEDEAILSDGIDDYPRGAAPHDQ